MSALGADADATTAFLRSKRAADDALVAMSVDARVALPSLVYGGGGASAALFTTLASLPLVPLPGNGAQELQPIHVDDLVSALAALVERDDVGRGRFALVGPAPLALRDFLAALRAGMRLPRARFVAIPRPLIGFAATVAPATLADRDALAMLDRGSVADPAATTMLLGGPARGADAFVARDEAASVRRDAQLRWLLPPLRAAVAVVFIATGVVSLGVYPIDESAALVVRTGAPAAIARALVYAGAFVDLALGVLVFALRGVPRRWLWRAQAALIVVYTAIITWKLPEFWLHPYGPVLKNLPLLAAIALLHALEDE